MAAFTRCIAVAGVLAIGLLFWNAARSAGAPSNLSSLVDADDDTGAEIYMTRCMSCHQVNGRGVPGVFPPLVGTEWVTGDKGRLIRIVLGGLTGEIKIGDETYSGAMPPWGGFLNDEQMAALLTYIRTHWENEASEVFPDEVARVREATAERRAPWTAAELLQEENSGIPRGESDAPTSD